ncbi:MAG: TIGR00374 family protein [Alphaproteobacteria bacterium]|nr:TIGR00374 family protein [Alphaproteobacteria bacterium]
MIRATAFFGLLGLALATGLIVYHGAGEVFTVLAGAGFGILWASLFHLIPMAVNARAWQVLLPGAARPGIIFFTWAVWVRESVNGLLPVARVGGEIVSARLLIWHGVRPSPAVASLVVDMTLSIVSQFVFTVVGLGLLMLRSDDVATIGRIALALLVAVPIVVALVAVQRLGMFGVLGRLFNALFRDRWAMLVAGAHRLDRWVRLLYRRRDRIVSCGLWQLVGWLLGAGEIYLALYFLDHPVSLLDALLIEALAQAVSSAAFVVPAAIGVQEGGFLLFGALLGLSPEISLALALARRARDLIMFVPPLLVWQWLEARRLLAARPSQ